MQSHHTSFISFLAPYCSCQNTLYLTGYTSTIASQESFSDSLQVLRALPPPHPMGTQRAILLGHLTFLNLILVICAFINPPPSRGE